MNKFLEKDLYVKVFAFLLALILWLYVVNEQSPRIQRTFNINLEYRSLASGLTVAEPLDSIEVRVSGVRENVLALRNTQIKAYLDLKGIREGQYFLPVKVEAPVTVEIAEVKPDRIKIGLEAVVSKTVPVAPQVKGDILERDAVARASAEEKEVTIKGPRQKVGAVVLALAVVRLNEVGGNIQAEGKLVPVNRLGQIVKGVEVVPRFTKVSINTLPTKQVPVNPNLVGHPATGYEVVKVITNPAFLRVTGSASQLAKVNFLSTENVNLTGITSSLQQDIRVVLPEGIGLLDNRRIKLLVTIGASSQTRTFSQIPVVLENLPVPWQGKITPEKVDLEVEGQQDSLDKVNVGDLRVIVNGGTVTEEGNLYLKPQVNLPTGVKLNRVTPDQILLTVKKKN